MCQHTPLAGLAVLVYLHPAGADVLAPMEVRRARIHRDRNKETQTDTDRHSGRNRDCERHQERD